MSDKMVIVANAVTCLSCGDSIYSAFRHDYTTCLCGNCSVDGGCDYLKMSCKDKDMVKNDHISASPAFLDVLINEIQDAMSSGRNARGVAYAALRAIRNSEAQMEKNELGMTSWSMSKEKSNGY